MNDERYRVTYKGVFKSRRKRLAFRIALFFPMILDVISNRTSNREHTFFVNFHANCALKQIKNMLVLDIRSGHTFPDISGYTSRIHPDMSRMCIWIHPDIRSGHTFPDISGYTSRIHPDMSRMCIWIRPDTHPRHIRIHIQDTSGYVQMCVRMCIRIQILIKTSLKCSPIYVIIPSSLRLTGRARTSSPPTNRRRR